jgi:hypothetical protein
MTPFSRFEQVSRGKLGTYKQYLCNFKNKLIQSLKISIHCRSHIVIAASADSKAADTNCVNCGAKELRDYVV